MAKNVIIVILILITAFSMIYAFIKADEAGKSRIIAEQQRLEAEKLRDEAVILQLRAQESAAEALRQHQLAEEALRDCQSK
ncbi:hypothetical protein [Ekhidna sp.]|uniref:hypothetical protein n=1 Tax=Ekhidna sp. TaxID=2608089 RepID=UPI0032998513